MAMVIGCSTPPPSDGGTPDGGSDAGEGDAGCALTTCGSTCVDTQSDVRHCGGCGTDCTALEGVASGEVRCVEGACVIDACAADRGDCDGDVTNGCEAPLTTAQDCGACGASCSGATPVCSMGAGTEFGYGCASGCTAPTPDLCGGECVDTATDVAHCGACDAACTVPANGSATCDGTGCGFVCDAGFHACGDACVPDTAVTSCGASCTACPAPANASATCDGTSCGFACDSGFHLCGDACVPDTAVTSCGASCTACPAPANASPTCDGTSCGFACDSGFHACGDACVPDNAVTSCGASCTACPAPANGSATCDGTSCGFACDSGFHACGGACVPDSAVTSCGTSCTPCPAPANGSATCNGTSCGFTCDTGYMPSGSACVAIPPTVTLTASDAAATEGTTDRATFSIARTGITTSALTVRLNIHTSSTVTIANGGVLPLDFTLAGAGVSRSGRNVTVVIPTGASSVSLTMTARVDTHAESAETLRLDLVADPSYVRGASTNATATIAGGGTDVIASGDHLTNYAVREGSLRLALENARAVPGGATVEASITGPIALVAGLPLIDFNVVVRGPAPARLVITGNDTFRILENRATTRFEYLEFRRGFNDYAGAILNRGHLTVDHCRFANNFATYRGSAIYMFSVTPTSLTVLSSIIENNTGASALEHDAGTISIGSSTFSGNTGGNVYGAYTNLGGNTPPNP